MPWQQREICSRCAARRDMVVVMVPVRVVYFSRATPWGFVWCKRGSLKVKTQCATRVFESVTDLQPPVGEKLWPYG